ncbi:hypothetical protein CO083_03765 [Candidatus Roizmanbacteria bacterium CG_4_9_14_0_8_um_filter_34_12]|uniref:ABC-2 type transporter transmembrane domain-containing protein n=3 Tax=Candidatus Roizmaniibacteriota TaxID=1752723 RepID=A0A2H0C3L4_9BACT|nr:MAG: hypothetical protein COW96_02215 [Candidatus Roizmanbacteria bacterium CG22_combo_CG10-13_8_21_14_all_33_16]PIX73151.1 MAG: hypothetical protein COZ39_02325 [Candidatus Roizmanbacteria bacterium CG_4_10_14_3_um_filter_33_21]PJB88051.1 MAG: hypothetical protein CO083_03765 [Candidatus Roizmanbacteria bacterium CG_4_9_14_0_8_um_filter_34_12]
MFKLFRKELNYYLNNPVGYIVLILFAVFANFLYIKDIFVIGSASLRPFFGVLPWLLMIFIPALAMRSFAEEKRSNTIEVLLTLPISETQIVIAKFMALMILMGIGLLLTIGLTVSLSMLSKIYYPEILVGYLGAIFLSMTLISLSMFFSSLTKNQIAAFLGSVITIFVLLVMGTDFFATVFPRTIQEGMTIFTPLYHLQNFTKGLIDFRSVFYFISMTITFLFLTVVNLEKRA